jgi:hypothetical protein
MNVKWKITFKEMLEARITGRNAVVWRAKSGDIPDKDHHS